MGKYPIVFVFTAVLLVCSLAVPAVRGSGAPTFEVEAARGVLHDTHIELHEDYHTIEAGSGSLEGVGISGDPVGIRASGSSFERLWVRAQETELTAVVLGIRIHIHIVGGEVVEPKITDILPKLEVEDVRIVAENLTASSMELRGVRAC